MIKVCGQFVENFPAGLEDNLDELMKGELNSECLYFTKTPLEVYGRNQEEILKYARNIRSLDLHYDVINIYTDEYTYGEREFLKTIEIK